MQKKYGVVLAVVGMSVLLSQVYALCAETVVVVPLFSQGDRVTTVRSRTGKIWMDRNLGAVRVAGSKSDSLAYGWLYQWGRPADGHESRESPKTDDDATVSSDVPGHGNFIPVPSGTIHDWRSPQNNDLWNGVSGTNNPCPPGFRVPTRSEWEEEIGTWDSQTADGAYASPLKLTVGGRKNYPDGALVFVDYGYYWTADDVGSTSYILVIYDGGLALPAYYRSYGLSVRCIKY